MRKQVKVAVVGMVSIGQFLIILTIKLSMMIDLIFLSKFSFESKIDFYQIGIDCPDCEPGKIEDGQDACYSCLDDCGCHTKVWAGTNHKTSKCECR